MMISCLLHALYDIPCHMCYADACVMVAQVSKLALVIAPSPRWGGACAVVPQVPRTRLLSGVQQGYPSVSCTPIANRQPPTASTLVCSAFCLRPVSCWGCLQARCRDLVLLRSNGDRWEMGLVRAVVCLFVRSALGAWCCSLVVCWRSASWVLVCDYVVRVEVSSPVPPFLWPPHMFFAFGVRTTGKYHEQGRDVKAGSLVGCLDLPCPARGMLVVPHPKAKNIPAFTLLTFGCGRASHTLLVAFVCAVARLRGRRASSTRLSIYILFALYAGLFVFSETEVC